MSGSYGQLPTLDISEIFTRQGHTRIELCRFTFDNKNYVWGATLKDKNQLLITAFRVDKAGRVLEIDVIRQDAKRAETFDKQDFSKLLQIDTSRPHPKMLANVLLELARKRDRKQIRQAVDQLMRARIFTPWMLIAILEEYCNKNPSHKLKLPADFIQRLKSRNMNDQQRDQLIAEFAFYWPELAG